MNTDIIIAGVFVAALIVALLIFGIFYLFSAERQKTKAKLGEFQQRYGPRQAKKGQTRSAFTAVGEITTMENLLRRVLPRRDAIRIRLAKTGRKLTIVHYAAMFLFSGLVSYVLFDLVLGLFPFLSLLLAIGIGFGLPHLVISSMIKNRIQKFIQLFPDALDLLVRGLRSGLPITESINGVSKEIDDPVGTEFRKIVDQIKLGNNLDEALWETAKRIDAPEFKFFIISLAIQKETGGNLAETLAKLSDLLRRRQQMKLKIKAMASEGKASAYIVGALPFIMFFLLLMINYDYTSILFTDTRAIVSSIVGLIWMSIGGFIMSRMIRFEI